MSSETRRGFAFNHGDWVVTNRRLKQRGVGSTEWDVFTSHETAQQMLGGMVSVDESDFPTKGFKGMTLRIYNPEKDEWAIYWINSAKGVLEPGLLLRSRRHLGDQLDHGVPAARVRPLAEPLTFVKPGWLSHLSD